MWHLLSGRTWVVCGAVEVVTSCGDVNTRVIEVDTSVTCLEKKQNRSGVSFGC